MLLQFKNLKKYYRDFLAVDIPDLSISKGIWWLQGENGSGKTTLLKIIAGLHPFNGEMILDSALTLRKNRTAFLRLVNYAEAEPLYPSFITARDLVELYCKTKGDNVEKAIALLQQLHIYDAYKKPVATYSSGMVKKLSLVLAFIGKPKLIILDEPLITLDSFAIQLICNLISAMHEADVSFIITSHQAPGNGQLVFTNRLVAENRTVKFL